MIEYEDEYDWHDEQAIETEREIVDAWLPKQNICSNCRESLLTIEDVGICRQCRLTLLTRTPAVG